MAVITEPGIVARKTDADTRRGTQGADSVEEARRHRAERLRNEILALVAFCAVVAFVYFTRHYAS